MAAANKGTTGARQTLVNAEDQYNKRIDDDIAKLVDCFTDIVRVGENKDKDKFRVAEEGYQIESQSAQIVRSAESLLGLITELKQHLLLNDTALLSQLTKQRTEALETQRYEIKDTVFKMRAELQTTIYDLESVYFRSLKGA
ncbi:surfeit locus protein 5 subunit 22 of mediator complex-domain-containing protein [Zychaea mexicana]|uniref:surfeit locus protein 5 subunit 22 of mediator complex-domain-containing protein n=1 Tax=Zychaea mexicana TaxID=64656 RepID=UPI0022FE3B61|nr:surfeit locus protein 5 subunit 22 of mediator complex-domain-containing protein [Zychaea mexicana]KAI9477156.1 surfeit locus protein 5 subunit 22 of mediator complex-domain-containing protein [Zychaea mexicana]